MFSFAPLDEWKPSQCRGGGSPEELCRDLTKSEEEEWGMAWLDFKLSSLWFCPKTPGIIVEHISSQI